MKKLLVLIALMIVGYTNIPAHASEMSCEQIERNLSLVSTYINVNPGFHSYVIYVTSDRVARWRNNGTAINGNLTSPQVRDATHHANHAGFRIDSTHLVFALRINPNNLYSQSEDEYIANHIRYVFGGAVDSYTYDSADQVSIESLSICG